MRCAPERFARGSRICELGHASSHRNETRALSAISSAASSARFAISSRELGKDAKWTPRLWHARSYAARLGSAPPGGGAGRGAWSSRRRRASCGLVSSEMGTLGEGVGGGRRG